MFELYEGAEISRGAQDLISEVSDADLLYAFLRRHAFKLDTGRITGKIKHSNDWASDTIIATVAIDAMLNSYWYKIADKWYENDYKFRPSLHLVKPIKGGDKNG